MRHWTWHLQLDASGRRSRLQVAHQALLPKESRNAHTTQSLDTSSPTPHSCNYPIRAKTQPQHVRHLLAWASTPKLVSSIRNNSLYTIRPRCISLLKHLWRESRSAQWIVSCGASELQRAGGYPPPSPPSSSSRRRRRVVAAFSHCCCRHRHLYLLAQGEDFGNVHSRWSDVGLLAHSHSSAVEIGCPSLPVHGSHGHRHRHTRTHMKPMSVRILGREVYEVMEAATTRDGGASRVESRAQAREKMRKEGAG
ncbi:hypothetical protein B0T26DRAFT_472168 [Lasiosphaeria miniovina]|uniref:Uncharacterized protein n=1 Tax=Lasiosphaeria miniovina TaxID=1954250 RepID=A0AA39ZZZ9_9PEZI|nr:uncharacterized protein B0T26DRAFT_472168 [Lasiosphaeria miniovina]KAK0706771.1 hypothetical protein B0T26DRAFT_472168 [Lasiosphaeria miniovina]